MKRWAKEDRYSWENSEVIREFESKILSNYSFLEKSAGQKVTPQSLQQMTTEMNKATAAAEKLNKALTGGAAADDGTVDYVEECQHDEAEDCHVCSSSASDGEYSDDEVKLAKEEILSSLRKMANNAISSGNIKLAYKIERTISEVEEE